MNKTRHETLETRPTLIQRLQEDRDSLSWQEFYDTYGGLIRHFAKKSGLTDHEAEEVVQETAIGVSRRLAEFRYDPKVCRFKTWLLNLTRWRIQRQLERRIRFQDGPSHRDSDRTATVERIPDPGIPEFGATWDMKWHKAMLAQALRAVRNRINERHFQIFDLAVLKEWPTRDVCGTLGISAARVYLIKHRVSGLVRREVKKLGIELE